MRRTDGKYRANQLEILTASSPATFHDMILRRRGMCWRALSTQYLASRVFFMKLWIFMLVEVLELDPRRQDADADDGVDAPDEPDPLSLFRTDGVRTTHYVYSLTQRVTC